MEGKGAAEKRKDERGEADRREISDSNVFRWTAAQLVVLISHCNCGSMPLVGLQGERKEKKRKGNRKEKKRKKREKPCGGITPPVCLVVRWDRKSGDLIMEPQWSPGLKQFVSCSFFC